MVHSRDATRFWCGALVLLLAAAIASPGAGEIGPDEWTGPTGSVSLLPHLPYPPGERDQGGVATCWVWAGTAVLEIAHSVQDGVRDPLSIQFVDSNFNGGAGPSWAGSAGTVRDFAAFYGSAGMAVPRSNRNADYQDAAHAGWCNQNRQAWVDAASIQTTPHYPIANITPREVATTGTRAETIARIKALLDRGAAVHLTWRDLPSLGTFQLFWSSRGDEAVFDPVTWHGAATVTGVSHQMCVVGYDDTDPGNRYWLVLNSWGTANGRRPNGTFRLNMDTDYTTPAATWTTLDVTFGPLSDGPEQTIAGVHEDAGVPENPDDADGTGQLEGAEPGLVFDRVCGLGANEPVPTCDCTGRGWLDVAEVVRLFDSL